MMIPTHAELYDAMGGKPAFVDEVEIPVLCHHAADASRIVEIGCAWGGSTILFLANMPDDAHLSSVDNFSRDSMDSWQASQGECVQAVYNALIAFGQLAKFREWSLIPHASEYVAERWNSPAPIDLLFLDGDHSERGVRRDWELWTPFVRQGGVILLHDSRRLADDYPGHVFAQGWQGPTALANDLRDDKAYTLIEEAFSLTVWEKL